MIARPSVRALPTAAVALVMAMGASSAAAQACAPRGFSAGGAAAAVHYDMAGGVSGTEVGAVVRMAGAGLALEGLYGRLLLSDGRPEPDVVRVVVRAPLASVLGVHFCAVAHGGATRFSVERADGRVVAGGVGLSARRTIGRLTPFGEVRALAAKSSGAILDVDASASGQAIGGDAGAELDLGHLQLRGSASFDGLAAGLGATPYPTRAIRLELLYRF